MKTVRWLSLLLLLLTMRPLTAWADPQPFTLPIWPGRPPHAEPATKAEFNATTASDDKIAGRPIARIHNVTRPTITVYPARGKNSGAAVLVFPGGGYQILATDLEGTEVCEWFAAHGVTGILLKYRVPTAPYPKSKLALDDEQRAMGLVRQHAAQWHIHPKRIGVMGFSAGGHLAAAASVYFAHRIYPRVDAADRLSCRPDFAVVIYPGHLASRWVDGHERSASTLNREIRVPRDAPPTFILQAEDDPVDNVRNSLVYHAALRDAGVPVELHLFAKGGHAFGLRRTRDPITAWPPMVEAWMASLFAADPPSARH